MTSEKKAKLNKIIKNEMFRTLIIFYPLILIFLFLFYPKFDQSYFILAAFFTVIWVYSIISNIKNPEEMIKFKEEYNKRTPAEITKHQANLFIFTAKVIGVGVIIMSCVVVVSVLIFSFLIK